MPLTTPPETRMYLVIVVEDENKTGRVAKISAASDVLQTNEEAQPQGSELMRPPG
jgi:hypothetical protein